MESELQEELDQLHETIAAALSDLSEAEVLPFGFDFPRAPFDPNDVDFESGDWLLRTLGVQTWLGLPVEVGIDVDGSAEKAAEALFEALEQDPAEMLTGHEGIPRLSMDGAAVLALRLDSALSYRGLFEAELESSSRREASRQWHEAWNDESTLDSATPEPVKARTAIWPIQEFADKARKGRLNLSPTYQRGDVWPTSLSQRLIESILRGIPLPSVILLRPQNDAGTGEYEVVDGKQRLTSILRFIGQHPEALRLIEEQDQLLADVDLKRWFKEDYRKFSKLWATHFGEKLTATRAAEYYFPFKLGTTKQSPGLQGELAALAGKYYYEIQDETVAIGATTESVRDVFEAVSDYKVPLIEYLEASPRQIHEVFNLYNRQGKHLTAEEIRNALYHQLDVMRLLLVASGDNSDIDTLAPYLEGADRVRVQEMGQILTDYRFGVARYRRTKLLSWLLSMVMQPALQDDGFVRVRSTAKQIDEMLINAERDKKSGMYNPLTDRERLVSILQDLHECLDAHSSCGAWAPAFMDDGKGAKWQELQLTASLLGVFLASVVRDDVSDLLDEHFDALRAFSGSHLRPEKTQNATQWGFIGEVALGLIDTLGLDRDEIAAKMLERFKANCIPTLQAARVHYAPRQSK